MKSHLDAVNASFDPRAQAYLSSAVHAAGPDLQCARELLASVQPRPARALDLGTGAGHLAYALAEVVPEVIAFDASESMLDVVRRTASERGLDGLQVQAGDVHRLPFADASFDLVATRYSAHHWVDLVAAMSELRRVLRAGGHVLVIDLEGTEQVLVDTHLQCIELLRDTSHVRNRSRAQWLALLRGIGIEVLQEQRWPTRLQFDTWVQRMHTPETMVRAIRQLLQGAPREVREALQVEADGSFTPSTGLWWGRRAA